MLCICRSKPCHVYATRSAKRLQLQHGQMNTCEKMARPNRTNRNSIGTPTARLGQRNCNDKAQQMKSPPGRSAPVAGATVASANRINNAPSNQTRTIGKMHHNDMTRIAPAKTQRHAIHCNQQSRTSTKKQQVDQQT